MTRCRFGIALLPLLLMACSDSDVQTREAGDAPSGHESRLGQEAREWAQETKELGQAAWDATKQAADEAAVKGREVYENVKARAGEYYEAAKASTQEAYQATKEKTAEYYDAAKENTGEASRGAEPEGTSQPPATQ